MVGGPCKYVSLLRGPWLQQDWEPMLQVSYSIAAADEAFLFDFSLPGLQQLRAEVGKARPGVV